MAGARKVAVLFAVMGLLWAVTPGLGGMAELGRKRTLALWPTPEASGDPAAGDGQVVIRVDGRPPFSHGTVLGETVDDIMLDLAGQISTAGGLQASAAGGEITILKNNGSEVNQLGIENSDSGFGFVLASRKNVGPLRVGTLTEDPSGVRSDESPAQVVIHIDGALVFQEFTAGHTKETLNAAILAAMAGQKGQEVIWEDDDTGIVSIAAYAIPGQGIPTVSGWGVALLGLLLTATALTLMRRRGLSRA
jgi:hypothetical protein